VRGALYLAAFLARRRNSALKGIRRRTQAADKPAKVGIVAIARKRPTILQTMVRRHRNFACSRTIPTSLRDTSPPSTREAFPLSRVVSAARIANKKPAVLRRRADLVGLPSRPTPERRKPCNPCGRQRRRRLSARPSTNRRRTACSRSGRSRHGRWPCR